MRIWPTIDDAIANSRPVAVAPLLWDPVSHLLARFAFGGSAADRGTVTARGPAAWVQDQLALAAAKPGYSAHPGIAALGPLLNKSPYDVRQRLIAHGDEYGWDAMDHLARGGHPRRLPVPRLGRHPDPVGALYRGVDDPLGQSVPETLDTADVVRAAEGVQNGADYPDGDLLTRCRTSRR